MKIYIKIFLLQLVLLSAISCAKAPIYQSAYQSNNFKLAELNKDWPGGTYTSAEQGMVYGLTNDEKNLFVKLKIVDARNQRKILMNGLILWFDTNGKSKKNLGFAFPLLNEKARDEDNLASMSGDDLELRRRLQSLQIEAKKVNNRFMNSHEAINIISEKGEVIETITAHKNKNGINMMLYMDEFHILYYEAKIPLSKVFKEGISKLSEIEAFSFGFEIGELESGERSQRALKTPSPMGKGKKSGNGMSGKGRNNSRQPSYGGYMRFDSRPTEIWIKQAKLSLK